jgi:predicted  nucleic acid-binding Zn-ribbon protein
MKITQQQSDDLLRLVQLDQKLSQLRSKAKQIVAGEDLTALRETYTAMAADLLTARNQFEANQVELKRAEADLETVEVRIAKDKERLNASSSSKDIQGIESELVTLAKRKSDLEDVELALLEAQDDFQSQLDHIATKHSDAAAALKAAELEAESNLSEVRADLDNTANERSQVYARLGQEIAAAYDKKAAKGVAAGRLIGGECGACRMQLGAIDLDHILKVSLEEVVTCPECQALLVRN